jgi:NAD-dependent dihydropyrimidine dehydrogenase PreA subunit
MNRAHRPRVVAVVENGCTGCNACVDYCLVDCIEPASAASGPRSTSPVTIREDECIGCFVCAKVCEELAVRAIRLVPAEAAS